MIRILHRLRRHDEEGMTLVEVVVALLVIVVSLSFAAFGIAASFAASDASSNQNKAYQLIQKEFAVSKAVSFDKLGIVTAEATAQKSFVDSLSVKPCGMAGASTTACDGTYNRWVPSATSCGSVNSSPSNAATNPTDSTWGNESRVVLSYSNSNTTATYQNASGDPSVALTYPVYCAYYQFGQGNGDNVYNDGRGANPAGGVGTVFTVETDITWVNSNTGSGTFDSSTASSTSCSSSTSCFMAKRVTVTVRWSESDSSGKSVGRVAKASFVRAPMIEECLPLTGNGFTANNSTSPAADGSATSGVAGVSCA